VKTGAAWPQPQERGGFHRATGVQLFNSKFVNLCWNWYNQDASRARIGTVAATESDLSAV